jgi:hypothetical protein
MHLTLERIAVDDWFFQMRPQLSMHSFRKALLGNAHPYPYPYPYPQPIPPAPPLPPPLPDPTKPPHHPPVKHTVTCSCRCSPGREAPPSCTQPHQAGAAGTPDQLTGLHSSSSSNTDVCHMTHICLQMGWHKQHEYVAAMSMQAPVQQFTQLRASVCM